MAGHSTTRDDVASLVRGEVLATLRAQEKTIATVADDAALTGTLGLSSSDIMALSARLAARLQLAGSIDLADVRTVADLCRACRSAQPGGSRASAEMQELDAVRQRARAADLRVEAAAFAARGLEHAIRHREGGSQVAAQRLLGEVGARGGADAQTGAIAHFEGAISLGESLGMRPLVAQCHLGLGTLYRRMGDRPRARTCLTAAWTAFGDMAMPHWTQAADAELEALGSPPARL